jgi:hypothetical protein
MVNVELGEDLLNQVEITNGSLPDNTSSRDLKFDGKGTLHMMCRDLDGKLLKDVPIKEIQQKQSFADEVRGDYTEEHDSFVKSQKTYNRIFICIGVLICISLILTVATILTWR